MQHLVQKQVFNISAPSLLLAQQWESRAANMLRHVITPCIEQCFNRFVKEDEVILLNRLEVDLGMLSADISDQQIREKVEAVVAAALQKIVPAAHIRQAADLTKPFGAGEQEKEKFQNRRFSRREAMQECFIHFLVYGRLPWWAEPDKMNKPEWDDEWIAQLGAPQYEHIIATLRRWKHSQERLVQQFSITFIEKLLERHNPKLIQETSTGWSWIEKISGASSQALRKAYWTYVVSRCISDDVTGTQLVAALKYWLEDHSGLKKELVKEIRTRQPAQPGTGIPVDAVMLKALLTEAMELGPDKQGSSSGDDHTGLPNGKQDANKKNNVAQTSDATHEQTGRENRGTGTAPSNIKSVAGTKNVSGNDGNDMPGSGTEGEALYADAAGLVLLHPFLPELFRISDLWQAEGWVSVQAQHTAVLLVTWLGYGHTDIPEYNLIIPKLLCGMPWEETLDISIPLEDHHRQSGTELLEAVIDHWSVLGKTSADGLREGFIMRRGKVEEKKDGWLITVEKKAQDVLMGKLPWGISMIRLPWMKDTGVYVDWA
ncbi:contractile injection system tape measure protein [Chitinophaga niabensis]|uniref:contractile injection system tape measure protein n=1 Tax=Chitinophaga niabensis TaxID=536979 RepID=UPI0031BAC95C